MEFERTFDNTAGNYDKIRPDYVRDIFEDIFLYKAIDKDSNVLEIGMGSGKASRKFLDTGCNLIGIEPGENFVKMAKERYNNYPNFTAVKETFESYTCSDEYFDLIYAATSFHWIAEEFGYKRVFQLLKSGGVFARFAYHACGDRMNSNLNEEIQSLYARYMNRSGTKNLFSEVDAVNIANIACSYGFENTKYKLYETKKVFNADEYVKLLETYPDHMSLNVDDREKLFSGIHSAINNNGGILTMCYIMDLELATKP